MKKSRIILFIMVLIGITTQLHAAGTKLVLEINRGPSFSISRSIGFVKVNVTPHLAAWLEDSEGRFVQTVFVSLKDGKQDFWVGKRANPLPAWNTQSGSNVVDAITGASVLPATPQDLKWTVAIKPAILAKPALYLWVEVNLGFDYNSFWTDKNADPWGQPSILYSAKLPIDGSTIQLLPVAYTSDTTGKRSADLINIDSALTILSSIQAKLTQ